MQQQVQRLRVVLGRLKAEGLKVKLEKCAFFREEVHYLGHVISSQGVPTDRKKIEAVVQWSRLTMVLEPQTFLGLQALCGGVCQTRSPITQSSGRVDRR